MKKAIKRIDLEKMVDNEHKYFSVRGLLLFDKIITWHNFISELNKQFIGFEYCIPGTMSMEFIIYTGDWTDERATKYVNEVADRFKQDNIKHDICNLIKQENENAG